MAKVRLDIWSMKTTWTPIPEIGEREMHHVSVASSNGKEWGCWGRIHTEAPDARMISSGEGEYLWSLGIAGVEPGDHSGFGMPIAGLIFTVTGVCHHAAMRIAIPANGSVEDSPGNEIATPLFGRYGLGINELELRIEKAAEKANEAAPGSVRKKDIRAAIGRVKGGLQDEWEIVARDIDQYLKPNWPSLGSAIYTTVVDIYHSFYLRREALAKSLALEKIDVERYQAKMRYQFVQALDDIRDLVGPQNFRNMMPTVRARRVDDIAELAANYVFFLPHIHRTRRGTEKPTIIV